MSKIDDLKEKYFDVHTRTFNNIVDMDHTKTKKYVEKLLLLKKKHGRGITNNQLRKIPALFEEWLPYLENKDIYSYEWYEDIIDAIENAKVKKLSKTFNREGNVDVIFEDDTILLIRPLTIEGSKRYGYNTKWCTTDERTFEDYSSSGELFYLIIKSGDIKFAFFYDDRKSVFGNVEVYNQEDTNIYVKDMLSYFSIDKIYELKHLMDHYVREHIMIKMVEEEKKKLRKLLSKVNLVMIGDEEAKLIMTTTLNEMGEQWI